MGKCERCGGDIGIVPTICWKCFYSFLGVKTPEQREAIKEIEAYFAERVKEAIMEAIREKTGVPPKPMFSYEIMEIITNTLHEKEED